uniref:CxC2-like cysteine cluster KDZ transposase-associated domain-containing protein n=1 Tax=Psilocybe cubensis TaxID=181762 RepID=A0A8H8CGF2_PSICU
MDTHDIGPTPANNDEKSFTSQLLADPEIPTLFELDDRDDEDINLYEELDTSFHDQPRPRAEDNDGIPFKVIIHTSGVHYLPVRTCTCRSAVLPLDLQYLEMGLFATSFQNIRILFTLDLLEDFRIINLECKILGYQYYEKLRRITSPSFSKKVLNCYWELKRLSRQYRNLILHKIHSQGHSEQALKAYMELKYPQQGSEIHPNQEPFGSITPPETEQIRNNSSSRQSEPNEVPKWNDTTSRFEVDPDDSDPNNMSPEPPSRNELDKRGSLRLFCPACLQPGVNLSDDWVLEADSDIYICSYVANGNFKANHLNQKNKGDDVWLSVGEGFMTNPEPYKEHIKEAIFLAPRYKRELTCHNYHAQKAENRISPGKRVRGIGAHACARHGCFCPNSVVDFDKGEKQMHMDWSLTQMHWPPSVKIIFAIGLFHVYRHKSECLYNYASTYIPGVGIIDGKILEPLWSILNDTSQSTRLATTAHHAEVLDDYMAATIAAKYKRAVEQSGITEAFYQNLMEQQPPELVDTWEQEIKQAEFDRDQGVSDAMSQVMASKVKTAAGRQEIELHLSNMELTSSGATGKAAWISSGLKLEQAQLELRSHVRKLGTHPSTAQQLDLVNKQALESIQGVNTPVLNNKVSNDEIADIGNVNITWADPERQSLPFPSALLDDYFRDLEEGMAHQLKGLQKLKLRIRQGHAEDCLEAVRSALIQLSWKYKYQVHMADSVYTGTYAWDGVKLLNASWKLHKKIYNANRIAMICIAGHSKEDIMQIRREFPVLYDHDCKHSAAILYPNVWGGSSNRLSWIWRSRQGLNADNQLYVNEWLKETDGKKNYP